MENEFDGGYACEGVVNLRSWMRGEMECAYVGRFHGEWVESVGLGCVHGLGDECVYMRGGACKGEGVEFAR